MSAFASGNLHLSYGVGSVVGMGKMIKDKITKK